MKQSVQITLWLCKTVLKVLLQELPLKQAVQLATQITRANRNELYQRALLIKNT